MERYLPFAFVALLLAGCAAVPGQASSDAAQSITATGPKIVPETSADWTVLNPVVSISIPLQMTGGIAFLGNETAKLEVFPQQKYVTFDVIPYMSGDTACRERGQSYQAEFVASPGAAVSETVDCPGSGVILRFRGTVSYSTHSTLAGGTLTIDGKAQLHFNDFDNSDGSVRWRREYVVEMHGAVQIAGTTCRVQAWRHTIHEVDDQVVDGDHNEKNYRLQSAPNAACKLVLAK